MGGRVEPRVLIAVGTAKANDAEFPGLVKCSYEKTVKTIKSSKGYEGTKHNIPVGYEKLLTVEWEQQTPELQAQLLADDITTTIAKPYVGEMSALAANIVTFSHVPVVPYSETVWMFDANGHRIRCQKVAAAPSDYEYTFVDLTGVATFKAGTTGNVYRSYKNSGVAGGKRISDDDDQFPDAFTFQMICEEYSVDEGAYADWPLGFEALICQIDGGITCLGVEENVARYKASFNVAGVASIDYAVDA